MKTMPAACAVLALTISSQAFALSTHCHATSEREIAALFTRWNDSLKTGDAQKVVDNYAEKSVLLPTLSDVPRSTPAAKIDYFVHFLEKKPVGDVTWRTIYIGCNSAIDIGLYDFKFGDGSVAKARYTFTYIWDGKNWKIGTHHSSLMPEKN